MPKKKPVIRNPQSPIIVGTVSTMAGLRRLLRVRDIPCRVVEIRFDLLPKRDVPRAVALIPELRRKRRPLLPVLATFRSRTEGGGRAITENLRIEFLKDVSRSADLIDVEASSQEHLRRLLRRGQTPLIVSYHNFKRTPPLRRLLAITRRMLKHKGALAKIACRTDTPAQLRILRDLLRRAPAGRVTALGMGELGPLSRFWLPYQGSLLTYGYLDKPVAPGQVSAKELAKFFRAR